MPKADSPTRRGVDLRSGAMFRPRLARRDQFRRCVGISHIRHNVPMGRHNAGAGGTPDAAPGRQFAGFAEFYPFYLSQHADRTCRRLHFAGTTLGLVALLHAFATLNFWWLPAGVAAGYAFAWAGHFFFEKNRPATFTHPVFSLLGDWVMWKDILTGKIKL
jgi:hypothetical protein